MIMIDYKECPFCNIKLTNILTGTSTSLHYMCNSCKRYTWYENLMPDRLSVTQSFYDENGDYNIIAFSFHGSKESNHVVLRKGYTDLISTIEIKDFEHLKQRLEQLAIFS